MFDYKLYESLSSAMGKSMHKSKKRKGRLPEIVSNLEAKIACLFEMLSYIEVRGSVSFSLFLFLHHENPSIRGLVSRHNLRLFL